MHFFNLFFSNLIKEKNSLKEPPELENRISHGPRVSAQRKPTNGFLFLFFPRKEERKKNETENTQKKKREKKTVKGSRKFYGFDTRYGFFKKRKEREAQEIKQYQSKSIGTKQNPVKLAQIMENSPPPKPIRNQLNPRKVQEDTIRPHIIN